MGSASSAVDKAAAEETKKIDAMLARQSVERRSIVKILLLGPSEVGKSTILKQMKILHCKGFTATEYLVHKWTILKELVRALIVVTQAFLDSGKEFSNAGKSAAIARLLDEYRRIENLTAGEFERDLFVPIKSVLAEQELLDFLKEFERTSEEATFYFLDHVNRLCASEYVPNEDDLLRLRVQTLGINEISFKSGRLTFRYLEGENRMITYSVFDVGGQRSLRREWLHVFENVNSVMFLCALSDYNLVMREDHVTNRMEDALQLCAGIFNSKWFTKSALIIFLNKTDVFKEKLKTIPVKDFFSDYSGEDSFSKAAKYFENKFVACCSNGERQIFSHKTCATDTTAMKVVIDSCIAKMPMTMLHRCPWKSWVILLLLANHKVELTMSSCGV